MGEALRAELLQLLAGTVRHGSVGVVGRHHRSNEFYTGVKVFHIRMAIDDDVGQVTQHLGTPVSPVGRLHKLRVFLNEVDRCFTFLEGLMLQEVEQEPDIGLHSADAELPQGPVQALGGAFLGPPPGGDLDQQAVEEGRYFSAWKGAAGIQPNAYSGGGAIGDECAVIWCKVIARFFSGDPALYGKAAQLDILLAVDEDGLVV